MVQKKIKKNKSENKNKRYIETARIYAENHIDEELTVKAIADKLFISPNYLNCIFKKSTGTTIPKYITKIRLEKAKELLKDIKLKVYEVVDKVGYRHVPHFTFIFRKYTGMTPSEYRNNIYV